MKLKASASPWKKVDLEKINPKCLHDPADSYPAFCRKWIHLNSPRLTIWYNGQLVVNETANWSPYHWTGPQVDSQKALQAIWKALNQKYPYEQHALNWKTNWIRSEKLFVGEASRLSFEWATWTLRMEADHSIFCSSLKKLLLDRGLKLSFCWFNRLILAAKFTRHNAKCKNRPKSIYPNASHFDRAWK